MTSSEFRLEPSVASAFRRYWWLIVVMLIVGVFGAYAYSKKQTTEYTSTATMAIPEPFALAASNSAGASSSGSVSPVSSEYVAQLVANLQSPAIAGRVVHIVKRELPKSTLTSDDVTGDLGITPPTSSSNNSTINQQGQVIIDFTAPEGLGAPAANIAAVGANAVVTAYQQERMEHIRALSKTESAGLNTELSSVNRQLLILEGQINTLQQQDNAAAAAEQAKEQTLLNQGQKVASVPTPPQDATLQSLETQETVLAQRQSDLITQLDSLQSNEQQSLDEPLGVVPATESSSPSSPKTLTNVGIGAAVGLVLGALGAYLLALYRRRFSNRHEPEGLYGAPLLGDIPDFKSEHIQSAVPILDAPLSVAAESFRFAAASLRAMSTDTELGVIAITTANGASGKTTVTANMALALAEAGSHVLAIDGDFVRWSLSTVLLGEEISHDCKGLQDVISGKAKLADAVVPCALKGGERVDVLPLGTSWPHLPQSGSKEAQAFLAEVTMHYDFVLMDGMPLQQAAFAAEIISFASSTIMVVRHKEPARPHLELPELIDRSGTRLIGYVYNRAPLRKQVGSYYRRFVPAAEAPSSAATEDETGGARDNGTTRENGKETPTPIIPSSTIGPSVSDNG